jgi:pimeloyl-ACP methyl ester carboxylesterase
MLSLKFNLCVTSSTLALLLLVACNGNDTTTSENSKTDTMNTVNDITETPPQKTIQGAAGAIYVDDGGQGGIPVLFVHSFGGSTKHWANQLEHLRPGRRAIAFDLRGHGQSAASASYDYSVESLMNDIAAVADSLKLDRFVLVGHSMGGSAAIDYAGKYPGRVAGFLIMGTPGKTPAEQSKPIIASLESAGYDTVMENYMKQLLTNAAPATDKLERDGMRGLSKEASLSIIKAVFMYDPLPALRNYPGPKLIVSATAEDQPNSLHKSLPQIPFKTVKGTSHWIQLDKPEEFNRILDDFLSKLEN